MKLPPLAPFPRKIKYGLDTWDVVVFSAGRGKGRDLMDFASEKRICNYSEEILLLDIVKARIFLRRPAGTARGNGFSN